MAGEERGLRLWALGFGFGREKQYPIANTRHPSEEKNIEQGSPCGDRPFDTQIKERRGACGRKEETTLNIRHPTPNTQVKKREYRTPKRRAGFGRSAKCKVGEERFLATNWLEWTRMGRSRPGVDGEGRNQKKVNREGDQGVKILIILVFSSGKVILIIDFRGLGAGCEFIREWDGVFP